MTISCCRFVCVALVFLCCVGSSTAYLGCSKPNPCLYYTDGQSIKGIDINASRYPNTILHAVVDAPGAYAIDIDMNDDMLYWSERSPSWKIRRINLTSGIIEDLITEGLGEVEGIAVDWINNNLYWTDLTYEKIEVATRDGLYRKTLIDKTDLSAGRKLKILNNPKAIVVHPTKGYLFWTDYHYYYPQLARSTLAGTDYRMIRDLYYTSHYSPEGLALDYNTNRLYFIDSYRKSIESFDLDGGNRMQHHTAGHSPYPNDMTLLNDKVYWGDFKSHSVEAVSRTSWARMMSYGWLGDNAVYGIVGYNSSYQKPASTSCTNSNSQCSHLCLPTPSGRICACPNGVQLLSNNLNCSNITATVPPPQYPVVSVILANGRFPSEGRVEINFSGVKGTVCDDYFGSAEAHVVCRMLNYSRATHIYKRAYFGEGVGVIWLDTVKCKGNEKSISGCQHAGWGESDCLHSEDVGVRCENGINPGNVTSPYTDPQGLKVRLKGSVNDYEGRVEVFYQNEWGSICDVRWTLQDAHVVCNMLGYKGAWGAQGYGYFGQSTGSKVIVSDLVCTGNESSIGLCYSSGWGNPTCSHWYDVSVTCKESLSKLSDPATIRLRDGLTPNEGRVEVKHNGVWGTVCDDLWDIRDAHVVCRQLGLPGALSAPSEAAFGRGGGKVLLSLFGCKGNEHALKNCSHSQWGASLCTHSEDAGVVCRTNDMKDPREDSSSFLLVVDEKREFLRQIIPQADITNHSSYPYTVKRVHSPLFLAIDPITRSVYVTVGGSIYMSRLFDNNSTRVVYQGLRITGLAVDHVCKKLYWSDYYGNKIMVANLDGTSKRSLISVDSPKGIVLDIRGGVMYYTGGFSNAKIYRSHMDGSNTITLIQLTSSPTSIAHDSSNNFLYWTGTDRILYFNLSSNASSHILSSVHVSRPYGLTVHNGYLYWTDIKSGGFTGGLYRARLNSSASHVTELVLSGFMTPRGVASFDGNSIVPENLTCNDCHKCQQMCLRVPSGRQCVCSGIYSLDADNKTCVLSDFFAFIDSYKETAELVPSQAPSVNSERASISLGNSYLPRAIDWDPRDKRLYYSCTSRNFIARVYVNGSFDEIIIRNMIDVRALAIEHVARKLYFADFFSQTVSVSELNGSNIRILHRATLGNKPSSIAVYSEKGYLYWGSWGVNSQIHRSLLDGTDHVLLVEWKGTYDYYGTTQMTIDKPTNRLYWVGWHDSYIEYVDLDMSAVIRQIRVYDSYLWMPGGIALSQSRLCWTDQYKAGMFCGNRNGTLSVQRIATGLSGIKGLQYCKAEPGPPSTHPCASIGNGQCTHLCLLKPGGYSCACPDVIPANTTCLPYPSTTVQPTTTKAPTTTAQPTTTEPTKPKPTTPFEDQCLASPCLNDGTCQTEEESYHCTCYIYFEPSWSCAIYVGEGLTSVIFEGITQEQAANLEDTFRIAFVLIVNRAKKSRRRRAIDNHAKITAQNIYLYNLSNTNSEVNKVGYQVAVLIPSPDGKLAESGVMPAQSLTKTIQNSKSELTRKLRSKFKNVKVAQVDATPVKRRSTSQPQEQSKISKGTIAVVVVVVLLVIIIGIALLIYFLRKKSASELLKNEENAVPNDFATFSNPGYGIGEQPGMVSPPLRDTNRSPNANPLNSSAMNPTYEMMEDPDSKEKQEPEESTPENQYSNIPATKNEEPHYLDPIDKQGDADDHHYEGLHWEQFEEPSDQVNFSEGNMTLKLDEPEDETTNA